MNLLIDWLEAAARRGSVELLVWSGQALVLLACVWLMTKIYRKKSSALRHQVWLFGLIAVAVLPLWTSLAARLPVLQAARSKLSYVIEAPRLVVTAPQTPRQTLPAEAALQAAPISPRTATLRFSVVLPWFLAVWAIGVLLALTRLLKSHVKLRRALKRSKAACLADLGCAEAEALVTRRVGLRLSPDVHSPVLCGVFRATILLPADIAAWTTPSERRAMIQHELAHVQRWDAPVNLFQTALHVMFFFHPLVRYACRQLSLEREMACDDQVVALGAAAETYAEGILKVAERSLTPSGVHQLALFSAKQHLERRIDMILSEDRARVIARQWKHLILPAALIAIAAWLVAPGRMTKSALAQQDTAGSLGDLIEKYMGDSKNFDDLVETALTNPDPELRQKAVLRLIVLEGDGSTAALADLYKRSNDPMIKRMVISSLGRRSELDQLTKIAELEQSPELQERASEEIKRLKEMERITVLDGDGSNILVFRDRSENSSEQSTALLKGEELTFVHGNQYTGWRPDRDSASTVVGEAFTVNIQRDSASLERRVSALLRETAEANIHRDTAFFERVLKDDYIEIDAAGETRNKAEVIADVKRFDQEVKKFEIDDLRVSGNEEMAFATFLGTVYFRVNGQDSSAQYRYTVNFAKSGGELKIVGIHISRKQ